MPKLFNVGHQHAVIDQIRGPVIAPGDSHEFTDEQVEAGIAGDWSDTDPRAGLKAEREFKKRRDAKTNAEQTNDTPAEPEKE